MEKKNSQVAEWYPLWQVTESYGKVQSNLAVSEPIPDVEQVRILS